MNSLIAMIGILLGAWIYRFVYNIPYWNIIAFFVTFIIPLMIIFHSYEHRSKNEQNNSYKK